MDKEKLAELTQKLMEHIAELMMKEERAEEIEKYSHAYVNLLANGGQYLMPRTSTF